MYEFVFVLFVLELACVGLLIAPLGATTRRGIVRVVEGNPLFSSLRSPAKYFTVALAAAWVYCLVDMVGVQGQLDAATAGTELRFQSQVYRAQRNTLLCGTATLLLPVVNQLFVLLKEVNQLTASKEALTKQAEGAAAAYKSLSADFDELKQKGASTTATATVAAPAAAPVAAEKSTEGSEDELAHANATIAMLRERNTTLLGERDAATKDAEAIKRQAKGLSDEYGRLLAQKESLENKLADFELVMGDEVKKSK